MPQGQLCFVFRSNSNKQYKEPRNPSFVLFVEIAKSGAKCGSLLELAISGVKCVSNLEIAYYKIKNDWRSTVFRF